MIKAPNLIAFILALTRMNPISVLLVDDNPTFLQEHDDVVVGRIFRHPLSALFRAHLKKE
jgi:hypothetical protein